MSRRFVITVEGRFAALRTTATPLVGRDEKLALLERRWQQAKTGEGCAVLVSDEPGIGKSRPAQTLIERLGAEPYTRLRASAHRITRTMRSTRRSPSSNGRPDCGARTPRRTVSTSWRRPRRHCRPRCWPGSTAWRRCAKSRRLAPPWAGSSRTNPADRPLYAEVHAFDALVCLLIISARSLVILGRFDRGLSRQDAALAEARWLAHPHTLACALLWGWGLGSGVGWTPASLLRHADELLALSTQRGFEFYRAGGAILRGWCLVALGQADEGIPLVITGLADWGELRMMTSGPVMLTLAADACRMAGELQSALGHLAEARRFAEETEARWNEAETLRLYGEVLRATCDGTGAEANYRVAIATAQHQDAKLWELRAATSLARLWRDRGKRSEARNLLAPVYGWFTEGFGTPVLKEAKALLGELA
jgi:hypothetical protein